MKKLSAREDRFVQELLSGARKGESAIRAGYSPHTASIAASRLLNREHVLDAIRRGAEKRIIAGVAIGASVLAELAEKAKSEDVRLRAAQALLDRGGLPLVRQTQTRHVIEDHRSDAELVEHVRGLARELGVPLNAKLIEGQAEPEAAVQAKPESGGGSPVLADAAPKRPPVDPFED